MENNNAPQIAIWADYHTGHRLAWVEIIIRNVFEKTHCPVLVVMPTFVFQSQEYQVFLKAQEGHFVPLVLGREPKTLSLTPPQSLFQIWRELLQVLRELKKRGIKRLVVATGDELVKAAGVAGLLGWRPGNIEIHAGILQLGLVYPNRPWKTRLKDYISFFVKKSAPVQTLCFDGWAVEKTRERFGVSLRVCVEPLLSMKEYMKERSAGSRPDRRAGVTFGFAGGADQGDRKGADFLLDAFQRARLPSDSRLFFVGRFNPILMDYFEAAKKSLGERLIVQNKLLSNEALFRVMDHQMDVLCLPYRDHVGSSGFYAQAATLGKILIVPDSGWLGWEGQKNPKVRLFRNQSVDSLKEALEQTADDFEKMEAAPSIYRPADEEEFVKALTGI